MGKADCGSRGIAGGLPGTGNANGLGGDIRLMVKPQGDFFNRGGRRGRRIQKSIDPKNHAYSNRKMYEKDKKYRESIGRMPGFESEPKRVGVLGVVVLLKMNALAGFIGRAMQFG